MLHKLSDCFQLNQDRLLLELYDSYIKTRHKHIHAHNTRQKQIHKQQQNRQKQIHLQKPDKNRIMFKL